MKKLFKVLALSSLLFINCFAMEVSDKKLENSLGSQYSSKVRKNLQEQENAPLFDNSKYDKMSPVEKFVRIAIEMILESLRIKEMNNQGIKVDAKNALNAGQAIFSREIFESNYEQNKKYLTEELRFKHITDNKAPWLNIKKDSGKYNVWFGKNMNIFSTGSIDELEDYIGKKKLFPKSNNGWKSAEYLNDIDEMMHYIIELPDSWDFKLSSFGIDLITPDKEKHWFSLSVGLNAGNFIKSKTEETQKKQTNQKREPSKADYNDHAYIEYIKKAKAHNSQSRPFWNGSSWVMPKILIDENHNNASSNNSIYNSMEVGPIQLKK